MGRMTAAGPDSDSKKFKRQRCPVESITAQSTAPVSTYDSSSFSEIERRRNSLISSAEIKAFYMRLNDDGKTVAAMDMLVPGVGELIGGSQREERLDYLLKAMEKFNLNEEDYWWYLELRKYGGTKHAGFGLGFERLIMYITGVANIRDVESYPRTTGSAEF